MYNADKSELYFSSEQQIDFIRKLNIHHSTFSKHLNSDSLYLNKFVFSREFLPGTKIIPPKVGELVTLLENARVSHNKNKKVVPYSKPIILIDTECSSDEPMHFISLGACVKYLRSLGYKADQRVLIKRIESEKVSMRLGTNVYMGI
jgi:hypothetical protein